MGSGFCDDRVSNKKRDDGGVVVTNYLNLRIVIYGRPFNLQKKMKWKKMKK